MSNLKKRAAEELGGPGERREKEEILSRDCSSSEVLVRLGRTSSRCRFGRPWRSCAWPRSIVPRTNPSTAAGSLACLRRQSSLCPRRFCSLPRSSRRAARVRTADASLQRRANTSDGSPKIGAPPGESATFAAGLLSSRAAPVPNDRASGPRRSPLLRFVSPSAYASRAVLVRNCRPPDYPAATLTPFVPPATAPTILAGVRLVLAVFICAVAPELPIPVAHFALFCSP